MAGLVPAISFIEVQCIPKRDARDKPGHDGIGTIRTRCEATTGYASLFLGEERMRLRNKTAIVIGAGQGPGTGMGNGRATAIRFAQEGASVLAVDCDVVSAQETCDVAAKDAPGICASFAADVTSEASMRTMIAHARELWGRIDILHYNVGVSLAGGDASPTEITEEAFDRIVAVNLRGMVMACKYALPVMRAQKPGVILGISSLAAYENYPYTAYKATRRR
jgi:NAD(P)-dependent dehydrogenase (short-subunit alcohol dehydrogenase family)